MKKWIATLLALGLMTVLTGCNTVAGFGKDLEKVGDKVQGAAQK